jgi:hypothetical protein
MQQDLENYFGFKANIEWRNLPYWRLVASDVGRKKVLAKGDSTYMKNDKYLICQCKNKPIGDILSCIKDYNTDQVFADETNISQNVDIKINCLLTDLDEVNKELQRYGLNLVQGVKQMQVVVIRD